MSGFGCTSLLHPQDDADRQALVRKLTTILPYVKHVEHENRGTSHELDVTQRELEEYCKKISFSRGLLIEGRIGLKV